MATDRNSSLLEAYESEKAMPYITSAERIGIEKGLEKGVEKGLEKGKQESLISCLEIRFGKLKKELLSYIERLEEARLDEIFPEAVKAESLKEFCKTAGLK